MSAVIGCDYSSAQVYLAVTENDKVLNLGSINTAFGNADDYRRAFALMKAMLWELWASYDTVKKIYIEEPWVNGVQFPRSGMMLMRTATFIEIATIELNLEPVLVHPKSWRKVVYGTGGIKDAKVAAVNLVQSKFDYKLPVMGATGRGKKPDHNFAEAVLISYYGSLQEEAMKDRESS